MNAETFLEWREQNSFYFKNQISQFLCMISLDFVRYTPHDYNYTDSIEGRITEDKEPESQKEKKQKQLVKKLRKGSRLCSLRN